MSDDVNVTMIGEQFGRAVHRSVHISRCENGYIVKYKALASDFEDKAAWEKLTERVKVFLTNTDMLEFLELYFRGEPKP